MLQPASVDVHLGNEFMLYRHSDDFIDPYKGVNVSEVYRINAENASYTMLPGSFTLATTLQRVELPPNIKGTVEGKSTLGRLGLIVHSTAGFIDPGFTGNITLEMTNLNCRPILLTPGMPIAQLSFTYLSQPANKPYGNWDLGSKYQAQKGVTPPKPLHRPVWE